MVFLLKNMYLINSIWSIGQTCNQKKLKQFQLKKQTVLHRYESMKQMRDFQIASKQRKISLKTQINKCKQKNKKQQFQGINRQVGQFKTQRKQIQKNYKQIVNREQNINQLKNQENISFNFFEKLNRNKTSNYSQQGNLQKETLNFYNNRKVQSIQKPTYSYIQRGFHCSPNSHPNINSYPNIKDNIAQCSSVKSNISFSLKNPQNIKNVHHYDFALKSQKQKIKQSSTTQNIDDQQDKIVKQQPILSSHSKEIFQQQQQEESAIIKENIFHPNCVEGRKNQNNQEPNKVCKLLKVASLDAKFIESQNDDAQSLSDKFSEVQNYDMPTPTSFGSISPFINSISRKQINEQLTLTFNMAAMNWS